MSKSRVEHVPNTLSLSELARKASSYIERLVSGQSSQLLVMRHNRPAAVLMSVERYEELTGLIEELETAEDRRVIERRLGDSDTLDFDKAFNNATPIEDAFE